jgi:NAD(P)-dependent dehydrogenase (short-subunit alcohol dehydrogenase family)
MSEPARHRLDGAGVLITGAASGIGRATAERFHRAGARSVLVDVHADALHDVASSLGPDASPFVVDLGSRGAAADATAYAERTLGAVDVLVNNAGVSSKTPFIDVTPDEWERVFAVNVVAAIELATRMARGMAARGSGCILNVSSISGRGGGPTQSLYGTTKGALLGYTRELAIGLASTSVRVNAVLPGVIDTPMVRRDVARDGDQGASSLDAWIRQAVPAARIGRPEEVASVLLFLASSDGAGVTGAFVPVDGGFLAA